VDESDSPNQLDEYLLLKIYEGWHDHMLLNEITFLRGQVFKCDRP